MNFCPSLTKKHKYLTLDYSVRGEKLIDLKTVADDALKECQQAGLDIPTCIVVQNESAQGDSSSSPTSKKSKKVKQIESF